MEKKRKKKKRKKKYLNAIGWGTWQFLLELKKQAVFVSIENHNLYPNANRVYLCENLWNIVTAFFLHHSNSLSVEIRVVNPIKVMSFAPLLSLLMVVRLCNLAVYDVLWQPMSLFIREGYFVQEWRCYI
jgi:hypothetical protein